VNRAQTQARALEQCTPLLSSDGLLQPQKIVYTNESITDVINTNDYSLSCRRKSIKHSTEEAKQFNGILETIQVHHVILDLKTTCIHNPR